MSHSFYYNLKLPETLNVINAAHYDLQGGSGDQELLLDGVFQDDWVDRGGLYRHHFLPSKHRVILLFIPQFFRFFGLLPPLCFLQLPVYCNIIYYISYIIFRITSLTCPCWRWSLLMVWSKLSERAPSVWPRSDPSVSGLRCRPCCCKSSPPPYTSWTWTAKTFRRNWIDTLW